MSHLLLKTIAGLVVISMFFPVVASGSDVSMGMTREEFTEHI